MSRAAKYLCKQQVETRLRGRGINKAVGAGKNCRAETGPNNALTEVPMDVVRMGPLKGACIR